MARSLIGKGRQNAFVSVVASSTDSAVVAAEAGRKVRVLSFLINQGDTTASAVTFNSKPAGAGVAITPALKTVANGVIIGAESPGWFETVAGEGLTVTTGAGSTTGIIVTYEMVG